MKIDLTQQCLKIIIPALKIAEEKFAGRGWIPVQNVDQDFEKLKAALGQVSGVSGLKSALLSTLENPFVGSGVRIKNERRWKEYRIISYMVDSSGVSFQSQNGDIFTANELDDSFRQLEIYGDITPNRHVIMWVRSTIEEELRIIGNSEVHLTCSQAFTCNHYREDGNLIEVNITGLQMFRGCLDSVIFVTDMGKFERRGIGSLMTQMQAIDHILKFRSS